MLNTLVKIVGGVPDKVNKEYINQLSQIMSVTYYHKTNLLLILKCAVVICDQIKHILILFI